MNRSESKALFLIIVVGCFLRFFYALWVPNEFSHQTGFPDTYTYVSIARHVATEFRYANSWPDPGKHPRWGDIGLTSFREPTFPLFLALQFKLLGDSPRTSFLIQALLGTLSIPLCFGVGKMLFSPHVALLAALLQSVNPYQIYYATFISTENIATVVLLAIVFFTLRVLRSMNSGESISRKDLTLLILSLSVGILTRAVFTSIVLVAVIFVGVARYRRSASLVRAARTVGLLVLLTMVCVSPWFVRNYLVWQTFVYTTNIGIVMVIGFSDVATGGNEGMPRFLELDLAFAKYGYNEVERNRGYMREAFKWIQSNPGRAIYLSIKKQVLFWFPVPTVAKGYEKLVGATWGSGFLALALIGMIRARNKPLMHKYVLALIIVYALLHSIAIVVTRYRVPLEGVLAVFAGYGLDLFLGKLQASSRETSA